ncbi:phosphatidic acid phosphatase type 2/haloperoxidase [Dunaliella salina]|uniref:Phosphatidic acid phosphatase type 2/haloperoxidase n=1 Tax=Dunaliella salina TaxID=3046 RepID=A0ABQ7GQU4_DUNSA|nr:phosphatidic acid phosphatase type 2/haloperoxidase [Dunaliella salina]|eukprot:KAF5836970.1 phosphatidic acid phosphatase type 2/haloperoxidase [Dunaliella salina]
MQRRPNPRNNPKPLHLQLCTMLASDSKKVLVKKFLFTEGYGYDWLAAGLVILINFLFPTFLIAEDTVSNLAAALLIFLPPAGVFILACTFFRVSILDGHHAYLSVVEAFSLASGWKRWMNLVGRLRPHWLAVLAMGDPQLISVGRLSYPSGHTAYTFSSATVVALWLCGKLQVFSRPSQALYLKLLLCSMPLWLATFVACTRITDYKHDFSDVNAGSFIGIVSGFVGYSLNFHSLFSTSSNLPKVRREASPLAETREARHAYGAPAGDGEDEFVGGVDQQFRLCSELSPEPGRGSDVEEGLR